MVSLDFVGAHLLGYIISLSDRQCHNSQRRVFCRACGELTAVGYKQIADIVALAEPVYHAIGGVGTHAIGAEVMR